MNYTKGQYIGGGGFGKVYVALDQHGNQVALKELHIDAYAHDAALCANITRRFTQEAKQQAEIIHENVIRVLGHNLDAAPPFFIMELASNTFQIVIDGFLANLISFVDIKAGLFAILSGLGAIHELGIWHRDLKPQNVLFVPPNRYAISDFGLIAVRDSGATTLTITGTTAGTREYSPPEFMRDFKRADATSDVYSFGCILHDIFVDKPRVPYAELRDGIGKIGEVISKCTRTKQYYRYQSVEELREDLFEALDEFERGGALAPTNTDMAIFKAAILSEADCDLIIDMIENANPVQQYEIFQAFSIDFIELSFKASNSAANHIGRLFARYVIENSFNFDYCDVLADRLVHFVQHGDVGVKALSLIALLELGVSHNRWYVENRFVKYAGPDCPPMVVRRLLMDVKADGFALSHRLGGLFRSISVRRENLHPEITQHVPDDAS